MIHLRNHRQMLLALATACACLFGAPATADIPGVIAMELKANPDGTRSPKYRNGDKPPLPPTLGCDDSADSTQFTGLLNGGTAFSVNARAWMTGSAAATCTLGVETISGTDVTAAGFSFVGNNLSNSLAVNAEGVLRVTCSTGGAVANCSARNYSIVDPPVVDSVAPTIPMGGSCAPGAAVGTFECSWDPSMDPAPDAAGVLNYDFLVDGAIVATVTGQAGLSPTFTERLIGGTDGAPSAVADGTDVDLSFGGAGFDGTADNFLLYAAPVAGDHFVSATVTACSSTAEFEKCGVKTSDGETQSAANVAIYYQGNGKVQLKARTAPGANPVTIATQNVTLPVSLKIPRVGNDFIGQYSLDGGPWQTLGTVNVPMADTVLAGGFITSTAAGVNATGSIDNLAVSSAPRLSRVHTSSIARNVAVRARDGSGNLSEYGTTVTGTPSEAPIGDSTPPTQTAVGSGVALGSTQCQFTCGSWTDDVGLRGYLFSGFPISSGGTYTAEPEQADGTFVVDSLSSSTQYFAKCRGVDTSGNQGADSAAMSCTTDASTPAFTAPVLSGVSALSQTALRVSHTAVAGADHYICQRSTAPGGAKSIVPGLDHAGVSVDDTGLPAGSQRCYQCAASNIDESTIGPVSNESCGTTQAAPSQTALRWAPGHYLRFAPAESLANILAGIDADYTTANLAGWLIPRFWADLETSQGVYNIGPSSTLGQAVARAKLRGKKVIIRVQDKKFSTTSVSGVIPAYLQNNGCAYSRTTPQLTAGAALWRSQCMDRAIALFRALADEYGDNVTVVGLSAQESVYGPNVGADYSASAVVQQEIRRMENLRDYEPRLQFLWMTNWISGDTNAKARMLEWMAACRGRPGCMITGGPDALVNSVGSSGTSDGWNAQIGAIGPVDHRGQYPIWANTDIDDWNRDATLSTVFTKMSGTGKAHMMTWLRSPTATAPHVAPTTAQIRSFIAANPIPTAQQACPTQVSQGCNTQ